MPTPDTALSLMLLMAPSPGIPDIEKVACRVMIDGVCRTDLVKAGDGGKGGDAKVEYHFHFGAPVGGTGGDGAPVRSGAAPSAPKIAVSPVPPGKAVSLVLSRCRLIIAGKTEVEAKGCDYTKVDNQFTVTAPSQNQKYTYKISVALNEDKTGTGTLSGGKTDKVRPLGQLVRRGACWASEDDALQICAWK